MPELPEVETIIRDLRFKILDLGISKVEVKLPRIVKNSVQTFKKALVGNKFTRIERIGKLMVFDLVRGDKKLLVHLKMTGQLVYVKNKKMIAGGHDDGQDLKKLPNKYSRVVFTFSDKSKLFFNDLRTFGYLELVSDKEIEKKKNKLGIDALYGKYSLDDFKKLVKARKTSIKAVLLNQEIITGIGNIYADEILFASGVRPNRKGSSLRHREIEAIYRNVKPILRKAINYRGTTFNNFRDANGKKGNFSRLLKVYGRGEEKCRKCESKIIKIKVAGRGTHYCAICQK